MSSPTHPRSPSFVRNEPYYGAGRRQKDLKPAAVPIAPIEALRKILDVPHEPGSFLPRPTARASHHRRGSLATKPIAFKLTASSSRPTESGLPSRAPKRLRDVTNEMEHDVPSSKTENRPMKRSRKASLSLSHSAADHVRESVFARVPLAENRKHSSVRDESNLPDLDVAKHEEINVEASLATTLQKARLAPAPDEKVATVPTLASPSTPSKLPRPKPPVEVLMSQNDSKVAGSKSPKTTSLLSPNPDRTPKKVSPKRKRSNTSLRRQAVLACAWERAGAF